jgi:hypothetical protein
MVLIEAASVSSAIRASSRRSFLRNSNIVCPWRRRKPAFSALPVMPTSAASVAKVGGLAMSARSW